MTMPGPGEQHLSGAKTSVNPFEEIKPRVSEYTAQEIATLSSRLEKQLGPEYISSRPGAGGGKVHYLSADKCINLANEVFGFNGWSSSIQNIQVDFVDEIQSTGKISLGLSVILRVTLRDGTYHEDIGYGHIENCKGKAPAFEKAKKEGTTDALKRALRNFGNLLGNCVYDKEYVAKVTKLKAGPTKWDPDNLHRHHDFAQVKKEVMSDGMAHQQQQPGLPHVEREMPTDIEGTRARGLVGEDEFGSDDFDEADFSVPEGDHPDEIMLESGAMSEPSRRRSSLPGREYHAPRLRSPLARNSSGPAPTSICGTSTSGQSHPINAAKAPKAQPPPPLPQQNGNMPQKQALNDTGLDQTLSMESSSTSEHEPPVGFFTARAAETLQNGPGIPLKVPAFNPLLESPSIRKTAGVDHTKTKPVNREAIGASPAAIPPCSNFVNPQADKTRRLGMPVGAMSPLQNRGSYKPPQMKRPALGDVTSASVNVTSDAGVSGKRQRTGLEARAAGNDELLNV